MDGGLAIHNLAAKLCPTLATPWTVACQAPLSVGFSKQESWSGLPFSSPGDLPDPGIKPGSPAPQADFFPDWATSEAHFWMESACYFNSETFLSLYFMFLLIMVKVSRRNKSKPVTLKLWLGLLTINHSSFSRYLRSTFFREEINGKIDIKKICKRGKSRSLTCMWRCWC